MTEQEDRQTKRFLDYMTRVENYLDTLTQMLAKLDELTRQVNSIEGVAGLRTNGPQEIRLRQDAILASVVAVDDTMRQALDDLRDNVRRNIKGMSNAMAVQLGSLDTLMSDQVKYINEHLDLMPEVTQQLLILNQLPDLLKETGEKIAGEYSKTLLKVRDAISLLRKVNRDVVASNKATETAIINATKVIEKAKDGITARKNGCSDIFVKYATLFAVIMMCLSCFLTCSHVVE